MQTQGAFLPEVLFEEYLPGKYLLKAANFFFLHHVYYTEEEVGKTFPSCVSVL